MTEEERERQAEARRVRKELGPRCEVCQVIKKAGCGTEDANSRCLRHPRRGEAGLLELAASPPQVRPRSEEYILSFRLRRSGVLTIRHSDRVVRRD